MCLWNILSHAVLGDHSLLKDCGIQNGDVIIVEELRGNRTIAGNPNATIPTCSE